MNCLFAIQLSPVVLRRLASVFFLPVSDQVFFSWVSMVSEYGARLVNVFFPQRRRLAKGFFAVMHLMGAFVKILFLFDPRINRLAHHGAPGHAYMYSKLSDGDLIERYLTKSDEPAFETLLNRHYDLVYRRFLSRCRNAADAADLVQQLWLRILGNLENYRDDGKFPSFLMRSASNLLIDYWRRKGVRDDVIADLAGTDSDDFDPIADASDQQTDVQTSFESDEEIRYLTTTVIPALSCEQRMAFLLRHESEYWEGKNRIGWNHLAELNGTNEEMIWERFETMRNTLMNSINGGSSTKNFDCEDLLTFLVWTQAQRLTKKGSFTWDYFAEVLNVPVATMKTRYRAAIKNIKKSMNETEER